MSKVVYYISTLFFILLFMNIDNIGEDANKCTHDTQSNTTFTQKQNNACQKSIDYLYGNHFINLVQFADSNGLSKSNYIKLLSRNITIIKQYIFEVHNSVTHCINTFKKLIIDRSYYIFALRKIVI